MSVASPRVAMRPPKNGMLSPSCPSCIAASAVAQNWNDSFKPATSLSLGSVPENFGRSGFFWPDEALQSSSFPSWIRWATTSPKLIWAGVGLKPYLSAGIASAASVMFLVWRCAMDRNAFDTGFRASTPRRSTGAPASTGTPSTRMIGWLACAVLAAGSAQTTSRMVPSVAFIPSLLRKGNGGRRIVHRKRVLVQPGAAALRGGTAAHGPLEVGLLHQTIEQQNGGVIDQCRRQTRPGARDQREAVGLEIADRVHRIPQVAIGPRRARLFPVVRHEEVAPVVLAGAQRGRGPQLDDRADDYEQRSHHEDGHPREPVAERAPAREAQHHEARGVVVHQDCRHPAKSAKRSLGTMPFGQVPGPFLALQREPDVERVGQPGGEVVGEGDDAPERHGHGHGSCSARAVRQAAAFSGSAVVAFAEELADLLQFLRRGRPSREGT